MGLRGGLAAQQAGMSNPRLVLASQSPRRAELLQLMGLRFDVVGAGVEEAPRAGEGPAKLVARLSRAKAGGGPFGTLSEGLFGTLRPGRTDGPGTLVIGCDTIVSLNGRILGKPRDPTEATAMLQCLRGRSHLVWSALTCLGPRGRAETEVAATRVTMRAYSDAEIAAYVASGDPLDKAGGYAIQHEGFHPVEQVEGCYASVMGLPLCHLARCLSGWGVAPAKEVPTACQAYTGHRCAVYQEIITL